MSPETVDRFVEVFSKELGRTKSIRSAVKAVAVQAMGKIHVSHDPEIDRVVEAVAAETGIPSDLIFGQRKLKPVAHARFLAYWICHRHGIGPSEIGIGFGRDHSTVIQGCDSFRERLLIDELLRERVKRIQAALEGLKVAA